MNLNIPNDWFTVPHFRDYSRWNTNRTYAPVAPFLMVAGIGKNAILTSKDDGKTWTGSKSANSIFKIVNTPIGVISGAIDVAWNGSIWVAVGGGKNAIATSKDGITWKASKSANSVFKVVNVDLAPVTAECSGVAWNGSLWVAASTAGKNAIGTSKDGITWKASKSANSIFKVPGTALHGAIDVAWNGKLWVAVGIGKNAIATSKDGKTWKASKSANSVFKAPDDDDDTVNVAECSSVAWNGSLWVAASLAKNAIGTSKDGITWKASKSANSIFKVPGGDGPNGAIDVAWNGSLWVAVGIGKNTIATSKDGKTWKASKNSIFKKYGTTKYEGCLGVAWNGSYWVAVGAGVAAGGDPIKTKGKIATSKDGKTWTLSKTEKTEVYVSVQSKVSNYPPY
jgi:hypothetical protein